MGSLKQVALLFRCHNNDFFLKKHILSYIYDLSGIECNSLLSRDSNLVYLVDESFLQVSI